MAKYYDTAVGHYGDAEPSQSANPTDTTCIHHWVLEPVGLTPSGKCKLCGVTRVFTNKLYEKPGDAGIRPTEKQRQAINSDLRAREFIANGLVRQQRYD
jgi:hypothetical protein